MIFLHTADWQIGKPFAGIADAHKRSLVQQERVEAIKRIGGVAQEHGAAFVLVAGDLFDSPSADRGTVSAACSAIGQIGVPVLAIPCNHDHGGPGSVWEQAFFQREREALAPNLRVLLEAAPVELDAVVILPCPLLRRAEEYRHRLAGTGRRHRHEGHPPVYAGEWQPRYRTRRPKSAYFLEDDRRSFTLTRSSPVGGCLRS